MTRATQLLHEAIGLLWRLAFFAVLALSGLSGVYWLFTRQAFLWVEHAADFWNDVQRSTEGIVGQVGLVVVMVGIVLVSLAGIFIFSRKAAE